MRSPIRTAVTVAAAAVAAATLALAPSAATAAPDTPDFPSSIDGYAAMDTQDTCNNSAKPGALGLRDLLNKEYGKHTSGIGRACHVGGKSEHKEGRALDYHLDINKPSEKAQAEDILNWLLATDRHGNKHANARRLGIMYMIWDRKIWASNDRKWDPYTGENPHRDHIHFSLSWDGANKKTSWWTTKPTPPEPTPKWLSDVVSFEDSGTYMIGRSNTASFGWDATNLTSMATPRALSSSDFNGDGKMDIAAWEDSGEFRVGLSQGNGKFGWDPWLTGIHSKPAAFGAGDLNGDGKADIVSFEADRRTYMAGLSTGHGFSWGDTTLINMATPGAMAIDDANGYGRADIIAWEDSGEIRVAPSHNDGYHFGWDTWLTGIGKPVAFTSGNFA
jgi:hypothetical protein